MDCVICGRLMRDKPIAFRTDEWCCDICRKKFVGEQPLTAEESVRLVRWKNRLPIFGEQPMDLKDPWVENRAGLPIRHLHDEGPWASVYEVTQPGDEVRWFQCGRVRCAARKSLDGAGRGDA